MLNTAYGIGCRSRVGGLECLKDVRSDIRTLNVGTCKLWAAIKETGRQFQVSWNVTEDCHMTLSMNWKMVRQVLLKDLGKIKIFAQFVPHCVASEFFLPWKWSASCIGAWWRAGHLIHLTSRQVTFLCSLDWRTPSKLEDLKTSRTPRTMQPSN